MPGRPFSPVDLAPAFPDVAWAVGIAFVLALVTYRTPKPKVAKDTIEVVTITEDDEAS
ncbi:MAG: hypothetical protein O3A10_04565 [Chloroflexi bacterium]|nr:hypothetical protein [Chloroflexota bacterium]MDA1146834.1 hypothetical protein [Chloroflexota bacterium]